MTKTQLRAWAGQELDRVTAKVGEIDDISSERYGTALNNISQLLWLGSQAGAVQNAIQKGTAAPTTSAKYTTLNTYPRQWDDINRYAEGGMSRADLVKTITKWKNEGKISATAADEMARSFNLG